MATSGTKGLGFRYVAYRTKNIETARIGSLNETGSSIQPLAHKSGTALHDLYEVIEAGVSNIIEWGDAVPISEARILPTISGRDILAVGKNYSEHAKEFNSSGYDSSDKVDQPTHPVIFTKRATSIIAHGDEIYPHPKFTETLDYEGEIGVILGKPGFQIPLKSAMDHVWGYTIINDVTAREKQRDHKQFFIGKSPDTFCPIGPVAVAKEDLPEVLEVKTLVNGEQRQKSTTEDLIFDVATLVVTCSAGQTIQIGDTIATGTPAGVGFGFSPPKWLQPGDEVEIQVSGIGSLKNRIGSSSSENPIARQVEQKSFIPVYNQKTRGGLTNVGGKNLFYEHQGSTSGSPILFIHGLGGTSEFFTPLVQRYQETHSMHLFDLEGHGLSPTRASSVLSIDSFTNDAEAICKMADIRSKLTVVAHSMGCLVALNLAIRNPALVQKLVLLGPPATPFPEAAAKATMQRATTVREKGMVEIATAVATAGTSAHSQANNPLSFAATKISLLGQDPEGYAKACNALAWSSQQALSVGDIQAETLILTGADDNVSAPKVCEEIKGRMSKCHEVIVLPNVGHWHLLENTAAVVDAVRDFVK